MDVGGVSIRGQRAHSHDERRHEQVDDGVDRVRVQLLLEHAVRDGDVGARATKESSDQGDSVLNGNLVRVAGIATATGPRP